MRTLFTYPYCNFIPQYFGRTREYDLGLLFVDQCRNLLTEYNDEIPPQEAKLIEHDVTFLELSLYDDLNRWQEYLNLFEQIFREKRTKEYISTYNPSMSNGQSDKERFGRYLIGHTPQGFALVHNLYSCERRRAVIERKLHRQQEGKNVEHLKRHSKEKLLDEEQCRRYIEMNEFIHWMSKYRRQEAHPE